MSQLMGRPNYVAAIVCVFALVALQIDSIVSSPPPQPSQDDSQQVFFEGHSVSRFGNKLKLSTNEENKNRLLPGQNKVADQRVNLVEADEDGLYLLGLFDIHHSNPRAPFKCGPIDIDAGEWQSRRSMQNLEAFLWAIEQVNADKQLLPGIKLGSLVLDTCSSFLRTNQQLANLLHQHQHQPSGLPNVRQLMAVVADNQDWASVEAVASMSSAVGLSTFVTQSRSSKLVELARRYSIPEVAPQDNSSSSQSPSDSPSAGKEKQQQQFEGLLMGELMGIGKMLPPEVAVMNLTTTTAAAAAADAQQQQQPQQSLHDTSNNQRLYMIRMLLGNEFLADSMASLCQQMNWDLVSLIYDDELDMVDLHDELARQLFTRNIQLALDEQISMNSPIESYQRLVQRLASKTQIGSRVVLTLLGTGSARMLLESSAQLRNQAKLASPSDPKLAKQANSLLWVTISDREPYYSLATSALGTVAISNSVSLIPEFKSHFDGLASDEQHLSQNRWWPEYVRSILVRHQKDVELISNECTKWQEPQAGLLREKCRALSLSDLVRTEQLNLSIFKPQQGDKNSKQTKQQQPQQQQPKLSKYLAGGWEHNGMDVINSVLAIANGLESVRQTLCPGKLEGICDEMRQFVLPSSSQSSEQQPLPMMSELIYNELLSSTFQLADGRLFNLIEDSAGASTASGGGGGGGGGHQLEGKLKLFNLRYLQPNSIGFVKFGTFDRQDGLIINSSKALHYSVQAPDQSSWSGKKSQQSQLKALPLEQIKSSCEDSSKCLMLSQFLAADNYSSEASGMKGAAAAVGAISEEELASGLNSLFKLDHPAIVGGSGGGQQDKQQSSKGAADLSAIAGGQQGKQPQGVADNKQQQQQQRQEQREDSAESEGKTHELHWQPPISDHFHWPSEEAQVETATKARELTGGQPRGLKTKKKKSFEIVVLLPLHRKAANGTNRSCARQLNLDSSFQHLAALAFAGQSLASSSSSTLPPPMMNGQQQQARNDSKQIVELTTTVIDYCEQAHLAEQKLSHRLSSLPAAGAETMASSAGSSSKRIAVIDFDESVSRRVENLVAANNLLHLTIGSSTEHPSSVAVAADQREEKQHMHLSLMPSKASEIEALLAVIASMPHWKLVHLIYTDHHHLRDEFVRRANEANICVSKLIWIPHVSGAEGGEEYGRQLEKTKKLFHRELHDYRRSNASQARPQSEDKQRQAESEGLNSTRVLVVLASGLSKFTNRLILEASSESMLEDYVWLTSHEWLWMANDDNSYENNGGAGLPKPRHFVSTRFETSHESHEFANFLTQLTPAIHRPLPTDWFDEFWQQKFTCRLPMAAASAPASAHPASQQQQVSLSSGQQQLWPLCTPNHRLHTLNTRLDDRVHFVIRAIMALHSALVEEESATASADDAGELSLSKQSLMNNFREKFDSIDRHESQPYGFQIIHRLLPDADQDHDSSRPAEGNNTRQRQNSRQLDSSSSSSSSSAAAAAEFQQEDTQLTRVGVWRNGELTLATRLASASKFDSGQELPGWLTAAAAADDDGDAADRQETARMQKSLAKLESIESACLVEKTCRLCEQQIEQTNKLIQLEEARLSQSQSAAEPKAISSIDDYAAHRKASIGNNKRTDGRQLSRKKSGSILDSSPGSSIEFDGAIDQSSGSGQLTAVSNASSNAAAVDDIIQAAASSLFDGAVRQQIQLEEQADLRRHLAEQRWAAKARLSGSAGLSAGSPNSKKHNPALLGALLSLVGIICMLYTMTHLYPTIAAANYNHRTKRANTQSGSGIYSSEITLFDRTLDSGGQHLDNKEAILINYFLLTGLLMLYSINVAFVLPATMSVCWFRRIGLASSYTVILSSILALIMVHGTATKRSIQAGRRRKSKQPVLPQGLPVFLDEDPAGGGNESEVEVTFESLPPIIDPTPSDISTDRDNNHPARQQSEANLVASYQLNSSSSGAAESRRLAAKRRVDVRSEGGMPMTISLSLILIQIVVSLVWLIEQPPEPTLYLSCWYCSSPSRSQTLFLYEPLLSLLYPAFLLLLTWFSAIVYYHVANKSETAHKRQRLINENCGGGGGAQLNYGGQTSSRHNHFGHQWVRFRLRDSRSVLFASSLLIVTWSIVALKMISSTNAKLSMPAAGGGGSSSLNKQLASDCNTTTLVYANIISGAIVFALLFLYRLNMVQCNPLRWRIGRRSNKLVAGKTSNSPTDSFRSILSNHTAAGAGGWMANDGGHLFFTQTISQFAPRTDLPRSTAVAAASASALNSEGQHERLGLRQFSSYGTYNHGFQFDAPVEQHTEASCDTGAESEKSHKKRSKRLGRSSIFRAGSTSGTSDVREKREAKKKPAKEQSKLQRRPSAGSVASSTTKLVTGQEDASGAGLNNYLGGQDDDSDIFAGDDTISCASSVASSSTSQLHGNDLYPIDCSLQLDSQLPDATSSHSAGFIRSSSFRRQSIRRSVNKLSSVSEEQVANSSEPLES